MRWGSPSPGTEITQGRLIAIQLLATAFLVAAAAPALAQAEPDLAERADRLNEQGKMLYQEGDPEGAAGAFRRATALSPEPRFYFNLCYVLKDQGELRRALVACEAALSGEISERLGKKTRRLIEELSAKLDAQQASPSEPAPQTDAEPAPADSSSPEPTAGGPPAPTTAGTVQQQGEPPPVAEEQASFEGKPWSLTGHLGFGTPYGFVGVEIERSFSSLLAVAAGVGRGLEGPQLSAAGRIRSTGVNRMNGVGYAVGFGFGVSRGDAHLLVPDDLTFEDSVWLNGDVYGELRFPVGTVLRAYAGWGQIVGYSSCTENDFFDGLQPCDADQGGGAPYIGLGFGFAL